MLVNVQWGDADSTPRSRHTKVIGSNETESVSLPALGSADTHRKAWTEYHQERGDGVRREPAGSEACSVQNRRLLMPHDSLESGESAVSVGAYV
jgi:hypothetical protein